LECNWLGNLICVMLRFEFFQLSFDSWIFFQVYLACRRVSSGNEAARELFSRVIFKFDLG